jgi:acetyl-CoA synthetase
LVDAYGVDRWKVGFERLVASPAWTRPNPLRVNVTPAYVVLKDGVVGDAVLADEIKLWVRERLSAHEYPREVEFVDSMPLTTTGKVIRRIFRDRANREVESSKAIPGKV